MIIGDRSFFRRPALLSAALLAGLALVPVPAARAQSAAAPAASAAPVAPVAPASPAARQPRALSLDEVVALAEQRAEAVRVATAGVSRALGQVRQTRAEYFPQLSGSVNFQRALQNQFQEIAEATAGDRPPPPPDDTGSGGEDPFAGIQQIFAAPNTVTLGLQFQQALFTGGRIGAQVRAARASARAAEIGVSTAMAQARLDATQAYYDALLADRLVAIAESSLVQTERTLRQTRLARQVGTTAEFDLLRARVTRDNQLPAVIQARTARTAALLRLRQLLELPEDEPLVLTTGLEEGVAETAAATLAALAADTLPLVGRVDAPVNVEMLLASRSSAPALLAAAVAASDTVTSERAPVRQAEANVAAQEALLRATRAARLPTLGLSSNYQRFAYPTSGLPGFDEFFPNWTVSVGLQVPLLTGGRLGGQIQAAEAGLVEARAQLRQAEELARLDAQLVLNQLEEAAAAYAASAGTAEQASRAYTIAEVRFREGISTQVELDDSRLLLQQAAANRAQAARNLNVARARLALLEYLPLGAAQGGTMPGGGAGAGAQGGAGGGAGAGGGVAPAQRAAQTTAPAGGAGGFTQGGPSGGMTP